MLGMTMPDRFMALRSRDTTTGLGGDEQFTPFQPHGDGSLWSQLSRWWSVSFIWLFSAKRSQPSWFSPCDPAVSRKASTTRSCKAQESMLPSEIKKKSCYNLLHSHISVAG
uniref:Uncharacterized protein n=1 Tax=Arundo donax TaxID=35708 RepID=A0A0A8YCL2_ARUDO